MELNVKKCINIDKIFGSIRRSAKRRLVALTAAALFICQMPASYAGSFEETLKSKGYATFPSIYEVSKDKRFNVSFSRAFDYERAKKYIRLVDINGSEVPTYEEKINLNVLRLTPKQSLEQGAQYYVVVDPGVTDGAGENIISKGLFAKATVQSQGEYTGFVLENTYFTGGKNVKIVFSDELNIESASKAENYEVAGTVPKSAVVFSDRKSVSLTLSQEVGEEQKVGVFVSKDIKNSKFKSLGADYKKEIMYTDSGAYISGDQPYMKKETAASVSVVEKEQTVENAVIRGDLYIGASGVTLEDVQVDGTIYINPGASGKCTIKGVSAPRVEILSGLSTEKAILIDSLQTDILRMKSLLGVYADIDDTSENSQIYKTVVDIGVAPVTLGSSNGSFGRIEVSEDSADDGILKLKLGLNNAPVLRLYSGCTVESEGDVEMVGIDTPSFEEIVIKGAQGKKIENINVIRPAKLTIESGEAGVVSYYADGAIDIGDAIVGAFLKNGYNVKIKEEDLSKIGSSKVGDIDPETLRFTLMLDEEMYALGKKLMLKKGDLEILSTCVLQKGLLATFEIDEEYRASLESGTYDVSTLEGEDWINLDGEQTSYEESSDSGKENGSGNGTYEREELTSLTTGYTVETDEAGLDYYDIFEKESNSKITENVTKVGEQVSVMNMFTTEDTGLKIVFYSDEQGQNIMATGEMDGDGNIDITFFNPEITYEREELTSLTTGYTIVSSEEGFNYYDIYDNAQGSRISENITKVGEQVSIMNMFTEDDTNIKVVFYSDEQGENIVFTGIMDGDGNIKIASE